MRIRATDVVQLVTEFDPGHAGDAAKSRELTLALLAYSREPFSRDTLFPGHITCTGVVLSPQKKRVLLVHHRRLDRWLLPGGHVEPEDKQLHDASRREVLEETGAQLVDMPPPLVGIDVHPIPPNDREPLHLHHNLIFAFRARTKECVCSEESREVTWCKLQEFDRYDLPDSIRRAVRRAVAVL
jgi:8-oxo-dGTP pyrophosphatase MutT (NUDIX family)